MRRLLRFAPLAVAVACQDPGHSSEPIDPDVYDGLSAPVDIVIDTRGIPHVYAQTDADLFFAAGYQMATDRLFQMELVRRRALGRQSEWLGAATVEQDRVSRLFDFKRWGAANAERLREESPELYHALVAWTEGVNRRVDEVVSGTVPRPYGFGPAELDVVPERWTVTDHEAIVKMLFFGNSNSLERELLTTILTRNFPEAAAAIQIGRPAFAAATMPDDERPTAIAAPSFPRRVTRAPVDASSAEIADAFTRLHRAMAHLPRTGSNNWAVDGRHTADGRPLVAGDPHQSLQSPSLMYAQHLNSVDGGGSYDVIGWAFAGAAGIHLGHNRDLQWTATTNFADVMDIWEVELVDGGDAVMLGGERIGVTVRDESVGVAGEVDRTLGLRDVEGFGVLLPDDLLPIPVAASGHALLLNWTGFRATAEERCFLGMATATDLDGFEEAADLMEVGGFNFVAADATGISYRVHILVPDRGPPSARQMPYVVIDGNDAGSLWNEWLPDERLPRSRADSRGWIATANNDPWGFTFDGDVGNDPWYYGYFFASGDRAARLQSELTRLAERGAIERGDMHALQTDTHSSMSDLLLPVLAQAWTNAQTDAELATFADDTDVATLVELLGGWDREMLRDSSGALAFHLWMMFLTEDVVADELSILYQTVLAEEPPFVIKFPVLAVTGAYPQADAVLQEGRDWLVLHALQRAAALLVDRYGSVAPGGYRWGDQHGTDFANPYGGDLAGGWTPTDGGEDTVNVSSSSFYAEAGGVAERFDSHDGAIFRVVTDFSDDGTPRAWANFPRGNSGDPASAHFADTLQDWVDGEYTPLPFTRGEVDAATERTVVLEP